MLHLHFLFGSVKDEANFEKKVIVIAIGVRAGWGGGGGGGAGGEEGCSYPSDFLGSKRKFGQSQFLKRFHVLFNYFEEINIFFLF